MRSGKYCDAPTCVNERMEGIGKTPHYRQLLLGWPIVVPILHRLVAYIPVTIQGPHRAPLLNECVGNMIDAFQSPRWVGNLCEAQYVEIMSAALEPLRFLQTIQVKARDGVVWDPSVEAYCVFSQRHGSTYTLELKEHRIDLYPALVFIIGDQIETFEELEQWLNAQALAVG